MPGARNNEKRNVRKADPDVGFIKAPPIKGNAKADPLSVGAVGVVPVISGALPRGLGPSGRCP